MKHAGFNCVDRRFGLGSGILFWVPALAVSKWGPFIEVVACALCKYLPGTSTKHYHPGVDFLLLYLHSSAINSSSAAESFPSWGHDP